MNRRDFLTQATGTLVAASVPSPALAQAGREHKNIVLIIMEQFQHNVASYAGGPAKTPNLEKLAAEAVNFRTACTTTGLCSPARSALFTGRLGNRTSLQDNCNGWHARDTALDLKQTTLIEWTRKQGYFVGYYGKWHLGTDGPILRGAQGVQPTGYERTPHPGKAFAPDFSLAKQYYGKGEGFFKEKPGYFQTAEGSYETSQTHRVAHAGSSFLTEAQKQERPFFLTLGFMAVHPPYDVPKPYNEMYDWRSVELPLSVHDSFKKKPDYQTDVMWPWMDTGHMSDDDWRRSNAFYRGYVTMLDRALGEVLDAVKANGFADNTLVVVMADHGDMNGAHHLFDKGPHCYEELMRIPLLIRWPGIGPREIDRHVVGMDVNQTIVEWAGLKPDTPNVDSRSLRPLLERGDTAWNTPDEAFYRYEWYNGLWWGIRAVRTKDFKYCFNPAGIDELYNLRKDPAELDNLIDSPAVAAVQRQLEDRVVNHLENIGDALLAQRMKDYLTATRGKQPAAAGGGNNA